MAAVVAKFGSTFDPGDCVILNDPYEGGTHLPDIFLIKPLFLDGQHVAYCATIAHHTDIGGRVAGGNASDSTEIYQEGLRLPPLKLYERGSRTRRSSTSSAATCASPTTCWATCAPSWRPSTSASAGLLELVERWGSSAVVRRTGDLMAYTERLARAEIAAWPDGRTSSPTTSTTTAWTPIRSRST